MSRGRQQMSTCRRSQQPEYACPRGCPGTRACSPAVDINALKILVDASIVKPQLGGIATYVAGVIEGLAAQPGISLCVVTSAPERLPATSHTDIVTLSPAVHSLARRMMWRERELPRLLVEHEVDVLFAPTIELPVRRSTVPAIMVIHDLGPLQAPGLYGWRRWLRYAAGIGAACRRADHVVCVSNATMVQLRATLGEIGKPCTVVGEAGRVLPPVARSVRRPPYVLTVGAMLDHKNIETLVHAMDNLALAGVELHLAGPIDGEERRRLDSWRSQIRNPDHVVHHGFVSLAELATLYAGAAIVALPSLYEGYGLPMLEAMRAGAPVVASSIPAHHEVGGDVALYVDEPLQPDAWARTLASVLFTPDRAAGLERASSSHVEGVSWGVIGAQLAGIARGLVSGS
jgi:glycosyltransferase involved in cell wall biosynthesis